MIKLFLSLLFILFLSSICFAETKVFTQTVKYVIGENDSRQELRELATLEAKRQVLEQVGVYIESSSDLKQIVIENNITLIDDKFTYLIKD